jgi:predicted MFS family arabinose efflux permease
MLIAVFPRKRDRILLLPVIGAQLILGTSLFLLPVLVDTLRSHVGLPARAAGLLLSMELAAAALTTICLSVWSQAHSTRRWALIGGFLAMASTAFTLVSPSLPMLICSRFLTGVGAGIVGAEAMRVLSRAVDREKLIAVVTIVSVLCAAIWLAVLPYMIDALGYRAPYVSLLLVYLAGTAFLSRLPSLPSRPRRRESSFESPDALLSVVVVAAVFLTQLGQGAFWSMEEMYGSNAGFSGHTIGIILSVSTLFLLVGAAAAAWASNRYGRFAILFALLAANSVAIFLVGTVAIRWVYIVGNILQSVTNLSSVICQLGLSARPDRSGRTVAISTALVTLGNGIGPGLSAGFSGIFGAPSLALIVLGLNGAALALYFVVMMKHGEAPQMAPSLS